MKHKGRKLKKPTVAKLKKELDKIYSLYVRRSQANHEGYVKCYTCPKRLPWKEAQCGHYISRSFNSLRFDPRNTKVQCVGCNIFRKGNVDEYAIGLLREYGNDILENLAAEKKKTKQWTVRELEELINKYKQPT